MDRGSGPTAIDQFLGRSRFNEAPIHESGKSEPRARRGAVSIASMRPRFMNRGSVVAALGTLGNANIASMRPRFMNRGSAADLEVVGRSGDASMRPRFMNRGSSCRECRGVRPFDASMRPRFMNRGSRVACSPRIGASFCFNEAPIHESGKC